MPRLGSVLADLRARSVGLYYLIRSSSIAPAAVVGGILWHARPELPFFVAGGFGLLGAGVFAARVAEGNLGSKPPEGERRSE